MGLRHHTLKAQLLVAFDTGQVIATAIDKGKTHDFKQTLPDSCRRLHVVVGGSAANNNTPNDKNGIFKAGLL